MSRAFAWFANYDSTTNNGWTVSKTPFFKYCFIFLSRTSSSLSPDMQIIPLAVVNNGEIDIFNSVTNWQTDTFLQTLCHTYFNGI